MPRKTNLSLDALADNSVSPFIELANRITAAVFNKNAAAVERETQKLADLFTATLTLADLSGRADLSKEANDVARKKGIATDRHEEMLLFAEGDTISPVVPGTTFDEAMEDLLARAPILQEELAPGVPRFKQIQDLYSERHAFGLAQSFSDKLTERVQNIFNKAMEEGRPVKSTQEAIAKAGDFTRAYSETVYRTNLSTAYTAGRFQQMQEPLTQLVFGALEFVAVTDSDTRKNHLAAHGLVAPVNDPIWNRLSPPLGYNCRCAVFPVDRIKLKTRGLIDRNGMVKRRSTAKLAQARPDSPSFGRRPDSTLYS